MQYVSLYLTVLMFIYGQYTCTATLLIKTRHTTLLSRILFLLVSLTLYYPMQPDADLCVFAW